MSDLRETLTPGRDAGFGTDPDPKPSQKKASTKKADKPATDKE